jgi:hypothetical protein
VILLEHKFSADSVVCLDNLKEIFLPLFPKCEQKREVRWKLACPFEVFQDLGKWTHFNIALLPLQGSQLDRLAEPFDLLLLVNLLDQRFDPLERGKSEDARLLNQRDHLSVAISQSLRFSPVVVAFEHFDPEFLKLLDYGVIDFPQLQQQKVNQVCYVSQHAFLLLICG